MFYFRKLELILRFHELTANDVQCLMSKDTYSIAHSFKHLLLSIYLGVDKIKNICTKQSLFQTDNRNCGFYLILTNAFRGNKNNSSLLFLGQDYLFLWFMHFPNFLTGIIHPVLHKNSHNVYCIYYEQLAIFV